MVENYKFGGKDGQIVKMLDLHSIERIVQGTIKVK